MEYQEFIKQNNFYLHDKCHCGGVYQEKYKHRTNKYVMLVVMPHKEQFHLIKHAQVAVNGPLSDINKTLAFL